MKTIPKINKIRVADEVFERMKNSIISGDWKPGQKIPAEILLCEMMGVSRVSVREAIHRLVGIGVLTIKRGEGTFVSEVLPQDEFNSLLPYIVVEKVDIEEVLEVRRIIEVECVKLATQKATEEEIEGLERLVKKMEASCENYKEFAKADLKFHNSIALASRNRVLIKIITIIYDILKDAMDKTVDILGSEPGIRYHKGICSAMRARDAKKAGDIMVNHIDNAIKTIKLQRLDNKEGKPE